MADSGDALFRLAVVLSADVTAGEDLYQETLQRFSAHWGTLDNPDAWTRRVMHNLAVDRFRARRSRPAEVPASDGRSEPADRRSVDRLEAVEVRPALFDAATTDLHAPRVQVRPRPRVVPLSVPAGVPAGRRPPSWTRRVLTTGGAAAAGALVAVVVAVFGFGAGTTSEIRVVPGSAPNGERTSAPAPSGASGPPGVSGPAVLYQLASTVRSLPAPTGRYAVQIEQQTEGSSTYLKASIIDSRTGDSWTYQRGPGVPAVLPMAAGFSPSEAQLQSSDPTDLTRLRSALIAQAYAAGVGTGSQTPDDLAVTQAIDTLWNPLVQPPLRAALVSVIASSPGVITNPHATDARGRRAIKISYIDAALGTRLSVYLDPSTGVVLEGSERTYTATARVPSGKDVYLSQYWTDTSPTVNPLGH